MITLATSIISSITAIAVVILQIKVGKQKSEDDQREKRRVKEMLLSLQLNAAVLKLSVVSANALTNGHNNGNVEAARKEAVEAEKAYMEFMRETMAEELA